LKIYSVRDRVCNYETNCIALHSTGRYVLNKHLAFEWRFRSVMLTSRLNEIS